MTYSIPTQFGDTDDDLYESTERSGSVTVTLSDDPAGGRTYYTVQNFTRSFPKTIRSEDIPNLTISPPTTPVSEGETATFTITAEGKWDTAMTVYIDVSSEPEGLIGTPAPVTEIVFAPNLSADSVNMNFRVPTVESSQYRIGGLKLKANLGTSLGLYNQHYSVVQDDSTDPDCSVTSTTKSCSEIIIRDKDNPPAVSITTESSTISTGETATFTITATGNWTPALNVELELAKVGDFFANNDTTGSVSLDANMSDPSKSNTFEIVTMTDTDDEIYESTEFDGSVSVTIKDISNEPAPNYTIRTSSVKVNVISEDIPVISISPPATAASEGDQVAFTITATGQWETKFSVAVNADDGNANLFGSPAPVDSIEFDPNTSTTSVTMMYLINTVDDDIDERENRITVSIVSSVANYHYSIPDDGTESAFTNLTDKGPSLTIESVNNEVTIGQPAQFRVSSSSVVVSNVVVMINVTDTNDCISGAKPTQTMMLTGQSVQLLEIMSISDQSALECTISVSLSEDARYIVGDSNNSATVTVSNEIFYTISISTGEPIIEGQDAIFTITTSPVPETSFELDLNIELIGNYVLWNVPRMINTNTTESETILTIKTHDDSVKENPGSISVAIGDSEDEGYRLGFPSEITLNISDNEPDTPTQRPDDNNQRISIADTVVTAILEQLPSFNSGEFSQTSSNFTETTRQAPSSIESLEQPKLSIVPE